MYICITIRRITKQAGFYAFLRTYIEKKHILNIIRKIPEQVGWYTFPRAYKKANIGRRIPKQEGFF